MNPALGREATFGEGTLSPAARRKRVAVVGAGPAGLRFAGTAAARGHSVVVVDAAPQPGGRLRALSRLPGRSRWRDGIANLVSRARREGVEIRLETSGDVPALDAIGADEVVFATGARYATTGYSAYRPERAALPVARGRVLGVDDALDRLDDGEDLGARIVIVDDGSDELVAGFAELAAKAGAEVHVVTPRMWWGESLARTYDLAHVMPRLAAAGVRIHAQKFIERVEADHVEVYDMWQPAARTRLAADTVVLALDREPRDAALDARRIGDCLAPRTIEAVIFEGEQTARLM